MTEESDTEKRAFAIATFNQKVRREDIADHLDELTLLAKTYGVSIAAKEAVHVREYNASTFISKGKLEELVEKALELKVDLILFDDEISPAQQRNLEKAFNKVVMDRTELILEVFAQRARTKEAHLQIELAKVRYQYPRLKHLWTHLSRQSGTTGGGGAYLKGEGEKQIEIDRRLLQRRIEQLEKQMKEVEQHRATQRVARQRSSIPVFALIGYTNAGKSTILNALTDAEVFVEDKLFATLDTTTRKMILSDGQEVLLIDTVGFIRKLPHQLVAAFKSTLEEAIKVDFLIHVVDVSSHAALEQVDTTLKVLDELQASGKPVITILNKIDLCKDQSNIMALRLKYPRCIQMSATNQEGFEELEEAILSELAQFRKRVHLRIPQSEFHIVSEIQRNGHIIDQDYEDNDIILDAEVSPSIAGKYAQYQTGDE